jgi:nucleoside-diphosphate-sugar epimerase
MSYMEMYFRKVYNFHSIGLRYFNVFGPGSEVQIIHMRQRFLFF